MSNEIPFRPIGVIHTPYPDPVGTPIQPSRAGDTEGTVELLPEFAAGLADLDGFSHVILLYHLHRSKPFRLKVVPFLDTVPRGIFATRSPNRPNAIGLSVVRLVGIEANVVTVAGVDMIDGTPVLDIKPYVGEFDYNRHVRCGWFDESRQRRDVADDRFQ
ncbi:MAG: tRNA (N6-threonylcarbamoyladenosine(37)-N6)-methyltransferase TrmO [bacterium]